MSERTAEFLDAASNFKLLYDNLPFPSFPFYEDRVHAAIRDALTMNFALPAVAQQRKVYHDPKGCW